MKFTHNLDLSKMRLEPAFDKDSKLVEISIVPFLDDNGIVIGKADLANNTITLSEEGQKVWNEKYGNKKGFSCGYKPQN